MEKMRSEFVKHQIIWKGSKADREFETYVDGTTYWESKLDKIEKKTFEKYQWKSTNFKYRTIENI